MIVTTVTCERQDALRQGLTVWFPYPALVGETVETTCGHAASGKVKCVVERKQDGIIYLRPIPQGHEPKGYPTNETLRPG